MVKRPDRRTRLDQKLASPEQLREETGGAFSN